MDLEDRIEVISEFLEQKITYFEHYVGLLKNKKSLNKGELDRLFMDILTK